MWVWGLGLVQGLILGFGVWDSVWVWVWGLGLGLGFGYGFGFGSGAGFEVWG